MGLYISAVIPVVSLQEDFARGVVREIYSTVFTFILFNFLSRGMRRFVSCRMNEWMQRLHPQYSHNTNFSIPNFCMQYQILLSFLPLHLLPSNLESHVFFQCLSSLLLVHPFFFHFLSQVLLFGKTLIRYSTLVTFIPCILIWCHFLSFSLCSKDFLSLSCVITSPTPKPPFLVLHLLRSCLPGLVYPPPPSQYFTAPFSVSNDSSEHNRTFPISSLHLWSTFLLSQSWHLIHATLEYSSFFICHFILPVSDVQMSHPSHSAVIRDSVFPSLKAWVLL